MNTFTWDPRLSISDIFSFVALIVSISGLFYTLRVDRKGTQNAIAQKRNEAEILCNEALDLMNGKRTGTEALYIDFERPASGEERYYFESALQKIDEAIRKSPDFYLGHQYLGIYTLKMDGFDVFKRAQNALPHYQRAVLLLSQDKSLRAQKDGWPFHDLAVAFYYAGDQVNAENYYQKALDVNGTTEPDFYADFARFQLHAKGDRKKHDELYEMARKIASAGHRKSNRPDLQD